MKDDGSAALVMCLLLPFALSGCGGRAEAKPVDVEGVVRFEDKRPVPEMILNLHPEDAANQNNRPSDLVKKDGTFHVQCLPGKYRVTVSPIPKGAGGAAGPTAGSPAAAGSVFPGDADYQSKERTPWVIAVPAEGTKDLVLTVKKK